MKGLRIIRDIFHHDIILENERALLRPIKISDVDNLISFSLNEPELWKYSLVTAAGEENLHTYVSDAVKKRDDQKEYTFVVFDKKENRYAGSTRFYDIQQGYLTTQLGYTWYGKDFQRSGLNRHCKLLLLTFVFEQWGMERLEFRADARNQRSIDAMKDIGCMQEGILRNHLPTVDGARRDSIVLSILRKEWFDGVKKKLEQKIY